MASKTRKERKTTTNNDDDGDDHNDKDEHDPNGSLGIARGITDAEASRKRREEQLNKATPEDRERIQTHLEGPNPFHAQMRRKLLHEDDTNPNYSKLSDRQVRHLQHRKSQGRGDKVLQAKLERLETKRFDAATEAASAQVILHTETPGIVQAENEMERTTALTQVELKRKHLNQQTARHVYQLNLTQYAPYGMQYDRSGRYAILYGQQGGHLALMDCHEQALQSEFYVQERVRDACFLHNYTLFAAAQTNHVYIYDNHGTEIHRLSDHNDPFALQFLPYHWLLASVGRAGWLKFQDTSTGALVSRHRTRSGACQVMRQNPQNAVMHLGHTNGTVTLWSPASSDYLVKMLCHKGAKITSLAVDLSGNYMVTGGGDRQIKVWDLRMFRETHAYYSAAGVPTSLDISQRGILGVGHAGHATFWSADAIRQKVSDPYMHHAMPTCGPVETLRFRPYEDVCGIGHAKGISSIVIPGSGEPNLDSTEYNANPHQDKKQRREAEVRALLDKLSPNMIGLDPDVVGGIEASDPHLRLERLRDLQEDANAKLANASKKKEKNKKRGRSKIQSKLRRKHKNVLDANTIKLKEAREKEKTDQKLLEGETAQETPKESAPAALKRFF